MSESSDDPVPLTKDAFLGGKILILQPETGYRAGTDPVFLAAAVPAVAGQAILELGCGVGVASLCLANRVVGLSLTGVEIQPEYAELAARNATANKCELAVLTADLSALPQPASETGFDHVMVNPPFFEKGDGTAAMDEGKEKAFREELALRVWIDVALRRLKQGGILTVIQRTERLPELLGLFDGRAGDIEVKPLAGRQGKRAGRVVVRAQKASRGIFRLYRSLELHDGTYHSGDGDSFSAAAQAVLRRGEALIF